MLERTHGSAAGMQIINCGKGVHHREVKGLERWLYAVVAAYVGISYAVSLSTNRKFLGVVERSRSAWRTKLYGFLDDADYKALADEPLAEAMAAYRRAEGRTTVIVVLVVVVMLAGSTMEACWIDPNILRSWLATAHAPAPGNP